MKTSAEKKKKKATCAFGKFRCGFAMKLSHSQSQREEETERWREEEGPHKCQTTSLDARWILSLSLSL